MNKCIDCVLTPLATGMSSEHFIGMQDGLLLHLETGMQHDLDTEQINQPCN